MMKSIKKYLLCLLICLFCTQIPLSNAEDEEKSATAEDVAIAFHKTGGIVPKFENWVKATEPYSNTPVARRPLVMKEQLNRLKGQYQAYNPKTDTFLIKTTAYLQPFSTENFEGKTIYGVRIKLSEKNQEDVIYFPYQHLDQNIMVVPNKFKSLKAQSLSENDYRVMVATVKKNKRYPLIIRLQADEIDMDYPYMVDNIPQWAFKTNIVMMESWTEQGSLIWQYTAPWYISPQEIEMQKLYTKSSDQDSNHGFVKALPGLK